jgi:hypothetical protein
MVGVIIIAAFFAGIFFMSLAGAIDSIGEENSIETKVLTTEYKSLIIDGEEIARFFPNAEIPFIQLVNRGPWVCFRVELERSAEIPYECKYDVDRQEDPVEPSPDEEISDAK